VDIKVDTLADLPERLKNGHIGFWKLLAVSGPHDNREWKIKAGT